MPLRFLLFHHEKFGEGPVCNVCFFLQPCIGAEMAQEISSVPVRHVFCHA